MHARNTGPPAPPFGPWRFAVGVAAATVLAAGVLLAVGVPETVVSFEESRGGSVVETSGTAYDRPYLPAVIPLVFGAMTLGALATGRARAAWVGIAGLVVFSGLFVFSTGLVFAPLIVALAVATAIVQRRARRTR